MYVLWAPHVYLCEGQERALGFMEIDGVSLSMNAISSLHEQQVLLSREPSLQPGLS